MGLGVLQNICKYVNVFIFVGPKIIKKPTCNKRRNQCTNKKAKPNQPWISSLVSEWEKTSSRSRQVRHNTCLYFSLLLKNSSTESHRGARRDERDREKERDMNDRKWDGDQKTSRSTCLSRFSIDALWSSSRQAADSPRILRVLLLSCLGVYQRQRSINSCEYVCKRIYVCVCVCVPSANEGMCLCGKEAKGTTWCRLNPPPTG